jgi:hypothetical protein
MEIILGVLLLAAVGGLVALGLKLGAARARGASVEAQLGVAQADLHQARQQITLLAKYQAIVDAEAAAAHVRSSAEHAAAELAARAKQDADRLAGQAQAALASAQASARAYNEQATADAARIVAEAQQRAEQVAGDALRAVHEAKRLEQTAQAMRNVIEGYGTRYIVPTSGLLDELAEEFGYAEAGQQLKAARERVRDMVKNGTAASCDYVEQNRRDTAIAFVADAFNGKVDTILAGVRHDNYGTLQQKINDAYYIVNNLGQAFRNARINTEYLTARLNELRWAVTAQELKLKEREEQRVLKERIREEERAQREFERALKEAEKEEEVLRKALEKARRDVEKAGEAQKAKYEEQLRELTEKLRAAEEKNQRALSMAQQTKSGHVYVISNIGSFGENVFKIGMTRRLEPLDRVRELGDASVPFEFDVHALIPSQDAPALENALHKRFVRNQMNKVNPRKEFFRVSLADVRQEVERLGLPASWTMAAEAREYMETQALERALANKTIDERAWAQRQIEIEEAELRHPTEVEATA